MQACPRMGVSGLRRHAAVLTKHWACRQALTWHRHCQHAFLTQLPAWMHACCECTCVTSMSAECGMQRGRGRGVNIVGITHFPLSQVPIQDPQQEEATPDEATEAAQVGRCRFDSPSCLIGQLHTAGCQACIFCPCDACRLPCAVWYMLGVCSPCRLARLQIG